MINTNDTTFRSLARKISIVENKLSESLNILKQLSFKKEIPVIGITGPPGVGKSTLLDALIDKLLQQNKKIAIIAVDPSSPFNLGALLGDRIRMSSFFTNPNVFIRSVATRGSLGGLSENIIEITDVIKQFDFDYIFIETVGVGQSEVEIASLADTTVVVLNPVAGDEIQLLKAGIIEIADVFVINKADVDKTDQLYNYIQKMLHTQNETSVKILKTIATEKIGINELVDCIDKSTFQNKNLEKKATLLTRKAIKLIQRKAIENLNEKALFDYIKENVNNEDFNFYELVNRF